MHKVLVLQTEQGTPVMVIPNTKGGLNYFKMNGEPYEDAKCETLKVFCCPTNSFGPKHTYVELSEEIFDIPESPTTAEVKNYIADNGSTINKNLTYLFYKRPSDLGGDYTYVYVVFSNGEVFNVKEVITGGSSADYLLGVLNPVAEPLDVGNVNYLNRIVEGDVSGQRWFIDHLGRGINFNKTAGDIEITEIGKGYISKSSDGETWKTTTLPDGSLITQKL